MPPSARRFALPALLVALLPGPAWAAETVYTFPTTTSTLDFYLPRAINNGTSAIVVGDEAATAFADGSTTYVYSMSPLAAWGGVYSYSAGASSVSQASVARDWEGKLHLQWRAISTTSSRVVGTATPSPYTSVTVPLTFGVPRSDGDFGGLDAKYPSLVVTDSGGVRFHVTALTQEYGGADCRPAVYSHALPAGAVTVDYLDWAPGTVDCAAGERMSDPTLTADPDGNVLAVWEWSGGAASFTGGLSLAISADAGATWTAGVPFVDQVDAMAIPAVGLPGDPSACLTEDAAYVAWQETTPVGEVCDGGGVIRLARIDDPFGAATYGSAAIVGCGWLAAIDCGQAAEEPDADLVAVAWEQTAHGVAYMDKEKHYLGWRTYTFDAAGTATPEADGVVGTGAGVADCMDDEVELAPEVRIGAPGLVADAFVDLYWMHGDIASAWSGGECGRTYTRELRHERLYFDDGSTWP